MYDWQRDILCSISTISEVKTYKERAAWCTDQFGESTRDSWWYVDGEFKFADPKDQVLFILRWR